MNKQQLVVQKKRGVLTLRNVSTYGLGATLGGALALSSAANAASSLDFTGASGELDGVKTAVVGIIGVLVTLIGIGIAWSYFKRTAK
ncbi:hypothetical protein [Acinetobacter seifertii]|uniref:hypothetical protein n=1 Tax=Acinetobacter seifertii TaxID=1530123 RepID=UPI000C1F3AF1|nr:hypothetical protein [Acinetobacter seifertii]PJF05136.1 hypothetical protein CVD06_03300 [Acinetobacter seifertii]PJG69294.1 hypothetical protein CVD08_15575 [Acinetobacter seifertii]